ncbi:PAS domain S-box protein [Negadavirga shengliensis]|uniref:histidine kinase n=1 Tax=Negadavirga shengliensis TaxID=1389218 RepID=A0ABV9T1D0_9BACT
MIGSLHELNNETSYDLGLFFELSPDLLCIAGYDGFFKKVNPALSKLLGYTPQELYSRPINDFVFEEDSEITAKNRRNIINGTVLLNFENRYVTKSGDIIWLSWTSIPVERSKLVYAIAKNITHKKRLDDDRNRLITTLTKINKELKQLNYTTSHDLRAPVNNLLVIFELLDQIKIQDQDTLEFIHMLRLSTGKLKDTLDKYVDALSQKEYLQVEVEELDMEVHFDKVLDSIKLLLVSSKAKVNRDFSELKRVKFNKSYLESIFLNLLTNSIKYAQPGCLPEITVSSRKLDGVEQLIFTDNGMGFDLEKVKDRIFGFQQKFHGHTDSKGIGLYLVYNHITSLGGQISIQSKVNEGSRFVISFKV